MRLVLLGAPGSGKGIQAKRIAERYGIPQIYPNELLRSVIQADSDSGRRLREAMNEGQSAPDAIILELVRERLAQPDSGAGFILNGYPRTASQALALDEALAEFGQPLDFVLVIQLDPDLLMERLVGRRTCVSCRHVYNIFTNPPIVEGICDECGGRLHHRADDNEETISSRLRVYEHQTAPLITYYRTQGKLHTVEEADAIPGIIRELETRRSNESDQVQAADGAREQHAAVVKKQRQVRSRKKRGLRTKPAITPQTARRAKAGSTTPEAAAAHKPTPKKTKVSTKNAAKKTSRKKTNIDARSAVRKATSTVDSAKKPKIAKKKNLKKATSVKTPAKKKSTSRLKAAVKKTRSEAAVTKKVSVKKVSHKKPGIKKSDAAAKKKKVTKKTSKRKSSNR